MADLRRSSRCVRNRPESGFPPHEQHTNIVSRRNYSTRDHPDTDCPKYCRPLYLLTPLFLLVPGSLYFRVYPGAFSMKQKQQARQRKSGRRSKTTRRAAPRMTAEDAMQELYSEEWFQALIEREVARRMNGESDALPILSAAVASHSPRRSGRPGQAAGESPESDRAGQTRTDPDGVHDPV
jgi:hypothetical protein